MKINIVGGGPSGLYFAILMKKLDRTHEITLFERDAPNDTFGWGIVFSDQTFDYLKENDVKSFNAITRACQRWDNVDVVHRDQKVTIHGNNFSGISRLTFLNILHKRCQEMGVDLRFNSNIADLNEVPSSDLLVGADGANSLVRRKFSAAFKPTVDLGKNKYIWLGTQKLFNGLTLTFREHEAGLFIAHSYKFDETTSTFIVECNEATWRNARFDWKSDPETCDYLSAVFQNDLEGHPLLSNNFVRWLNFPLVKNQTWGLSLGDGEALKGKPVRNAVPIPPDQTVSHHSNVVLLGDALHTAHFSIGSGTKLAVEDAIALARSFKGRKDVESAIAEFQETRKPVVDEYQAAAYSSLQFFENADELMKLEPIELAYKLMTRSTKIDHDKLKKRDPEFVSQYDKVAKSRKSEVRGQKSEVRSQKSEVGGQKSEVGGQKSEVGGQKSEGKRAHAATGDRKTAARSQK